MSSSGNGNYYFYIVNRFDSLIYEQEIIKNTAGSDKKVLKLIILNLKE